MNAGKIIKFVFYTSIAVLVFKGGEVLYTNLISDEDGVQPGGVRKFKLDLKGIKIPEPEGAFSVDCGNTYSFGRMLNLIEACEKVKYLDYLRFSRPQEAAQIKTETLDALVKGLHEEKSKLKKHIRAIKSTSRSGIPSKRVKSLKYYLRVVELNLQDLKGMESGKNQ
jgi:hypothetical protein